MKNTKNIIIAIVILILLLLLGWKFLMPKKSTTVSEKTPSTAKELPVAKNESATETVKGTLFDILSLGKSTKCVGSVDMPDGKVLTTVYASGKKSYSENSIESKDGKFNTYAIFDGEWMYSWGDMGMASKMKVDSLTDLSKTAPVPEDKTTGSTDENKPTMPDGYEYKCSPWIPDASKFNPPADKEFVDFTAALQGMSEAAKSGDTSKLNKSGCLACEMIEDADGKAECKANFECQ